MIKKITLALLVMLILFFTVSTASAACSGSKSTCSSCGSSTCPKATCSGATCQKATSCNTGTCPTSAKKYTTSACVPNFTFSKSGKTVQFKDATPKGKYWHWDFNNDGKIDSYMKNPKYTFSKAGSYKVCLDVSCGGTSGWQKVCKTVTV